MKTKIILGLGLCLLLTVINLQRAMDNYGITDAKFKIDVLAAVTSSSSSAVEEHWLTIEKQCVYEGTKLGPDGDGCDTWLLFGVNPVITNISGDYYVIPGSTYGVCLFGGNGNGCNPSGCREIEDYDFYCAHVDSCF